MRATATRPIDVKSNGVPARLIGCWALAVNGRIEVHAFLVRCGPPLVSLLHPVPFAVLKNDARRPHPLG